MPATAAARAEGAPPIGAVGRGGRHLRARAGVVRRALRPALAGAVVVTLALVAAACGGDGSVSGTAAPGATTGTSGAATETTPGTVRAGTRTALAGFKEVTITVVDAAGTSRTFCLLLADTEPLREQGLMYVTDPALGGFDGMLFAFDEESEGGFWMKNTRLPLSIAYLRADGTTTSTTDMAPCPAEATTCPVYPSGGAYRWAIEVPQGRLGALGIAERSRVTVGATGCAPAAGPTTTGKD